MQSGTVERVVDAAQAEALRDLGVERGAVGELPAGDDARRDAVGVDVVPARLARIGEDAVEGLRAVLLEVVVAQAAGEVEARR